MRPSGLVVIDRVKNVFKLAQGEVIIVYHYLLLIVCLAIQLLVCCTTIDRECYDECCCNSIDRCRRKSSQRVTKKNQPVYFVIKYVL